MWFWRPFAFWLVVWILYARAPWLLVAGLVALVAWAIRQAVLAHEEDEERRRSVSE